MRKQLYRNNNMLLLIVIVKNQDSSKTRNVIHSFLLAFLTLRRAEYTHLLRYQSFEVNHYICNSDALNMGALNS